METTSHRWDDCIAFTPKDVSVILNVPLSTVYKLCLDGSLLAFKIGTHWRIHRQGLLKYLKDCIDTSIII